MSILLEEAARKTIPEPPGLVIPRLCPDKETIARANRLRSEQSAPEESTTTETQSPILVISLIERSIYYKFFASKNGNL